MKSSELRVQELIEPAVQALGLQLWGVMHTGQGRNPLLRIFIESEEGITIDDCERASRQISAILDVEKPLAGEYTLEVSSPGLDRPLFTLGQFRQYTGAVVKLKMRTPIEGRRNFSGTVCEVEADRIGLNVNGDLTFLDVSDIQQANIVYQGDGQVQQPNSR